MNEQTPRTSAILLRSLALQLFLNYKTMQGPGYLLSLKPELRQTNASKTRAAASFINGHPAFSSIALGALTKRLRAGVTDEDVIQIADWKRQISTPLGAIGDSFIWERWKPALLSLCVALLLLPGNFAETVWLWAVPIMLVLYNSSLWYFRVWGFGHGFRLGERVTELALHPALPRVRRGLRVIGIAAALLVIGSSFGRILPHGVPSGLQFGVGFLVMLVAAYSRMSTLTAGFVALLGSIAITLVSTSTSLLP